MCSALLLAVVLCLPYLSLPACLPDGVCSVVAADKVSESLTEGFCGVVAMSSNVPDCCLKS